MNTQKIIVEKMLYFLPLTVKHPACKFTSGSFGGKAFYPHVRENQWKFSSMNGATKDFEGDLSGQTTDWTDG